MTEEIKPNPYEVLGADKNSSDGEIKKLYKKLSSSHHPDKGGSAEEFNIIKEAYESLKTGERREYYEVHGHSIKDAEDKKKVIISTLLRQFVLPQMADKVSEPYFLIKDYVNQVQLAVVNCNASITTTSKDVERMSNSPRLSEVSSIMDRYLGVIQESRQALIVAQESLLLSKEIKKEFEALSQILGRPLTRQDVQPQPSPPQTQMGGGFSYDSTTGGWSGL